MVRIYSLDGNLETEINDAFKQLALASVLSPRYDVRVKSIDWINKRSDNIFRGGYVDEDGDLIIKMRTENKEVFDFYLCPASEYFTRKINPHPFNLDSN